MCFYSFQARPKTKFSYFTLGWTLSTKTLLSRWICIISVYMHWLDWVSKLKGPSQIYYKNCPAQEPFNNASVCRAESTNLKSIYESYGSLPNLYLHTLIQREVDSSWQYLRLSKCCIQKQKKLPKVFISVLYPDIPKYYDKHIYQRED